MPRWSRRGGSAGPLLVASQTRNPLAVAMATFPQRLPWLMFGLYAGVLADRVSRRAIVIVTGLVRVTILVLLVASILTRRADTAVVLAALFLFGGNETFGETASATVLPMLVGPDDLGVANARALVWRSLLQIAHDDENLRAGSPADCRRGPAAGMMG